MLRVVGFLLGTSGGQPLPGEDSIALVEAGRFFDEFVGRAIGLAVQDFLLSVADPGRPVVYHTYLSSPIWPG